MHMYWRIVEKMTSAEWHGNSTENISIRMPIETRSLHPGFHIETLAVGWLIDELFAQRHLLRRTRWNFLNSCVTISYSSGRSCMIEIRSQNNLFRRTVRSSGGLAHRTRSAVLITDSLPFKHMNLGRIILCMGEKKRNSFKYRSC
jgi:hypothetical protein